jgi:hypothetical protein
MSASAPLNAALLSDADLSQIDDALTSIQEPAATVTAYSAAPIPIERARFALMELVAACSADVGAFFSGVVWDSSLHPSLISELLLPPLAFLSIGVPAFAGFLSLLSVLGLQFSFFFPKYVYFVFFDPF